MPQIQRPEVAGDQFADCAALALQRPGAHDQDVQDPHWDLAAVEEPDQSLRLQTGQRRFVGQDGIGGKLLPGRDMIELHRLDDHVIRGESGGLQGVVKHHRTETRVLNGDAFFGEISQAAQTRSGQQRIPAGRDIDDEDGLHRHPVGTQGQHLIQG